MITGLSHSTIRGRGRIRGSVSEPHSDQRNHPTHRWASDDLVRGHRLWTAVKLQSSTTSVYAAMALAAREGS